MLPTQSDPGSTADRRRLHRRRLTAEGEVCSIALGRSSCNVIDISLTGCRIARAPKMDPNDNVVLRLPTFAPYGARVAWWRDGVAGLEFRKPLGLAVVDHLVARHSMAA